MPIRPFSKVLLFSLLAVFVFPLSSFSQTEEETLTITTYYPAPYGVYNEMRSKRMAVGTNYYNGSAYPWDTGGGCTGNEICNADLVVQGNVGIGTTKPGAKLDIFHTSPDATTLDGANIRSNTFGYTGDLLEISHTLHTGTFNFLKVTRDSDADAGGPFTDLIVTGTGNVGIGTTSPGVDTQADTAKLEVVSTSSGARTTGLYLKNNAGAAGTAVSLDFSPNVNAPLARINANRTTVSGPTDLEFWTYTGGAYPADFTNKLTIKNTGNVGIGTTNPQDMLDVYGGGDNIVSVVDSASKLGVWIGHNGTRGIIRTTYWPGGSNIFTPLTFQTNNVDRLYIAANGNVGIGTAAPAAKLEVNGDIKVPMISQWCTYGISPGNPTCTCPSGYYAINCGTNHYGPQTLYNTGTGCYAETIGGYTDANSGIVVRCAKIHE